MNNLELDRILKSAPVPERPQQYWDGFAGRVQVAIDQREQDASARRDIPDRRGAAEREGPSGRLTLGLAFGFALAFLTLLIAVGFWHRPARLLSAQQVAAAAKYFREIEPLFPNQLEGINFGPAGAHLVLSDRADVPASPPLYVKICGGSQCSSFVTFSGQEIHLNGETFQVLVDRQGAVMVVAQQWVWSSSSPDDKAGRYRIAARQLPTT